MLSRLQDFEKAAYAKEAQCGFEATRYPQPIIKNLKPMTKFTTFDLVALTEAKVQEAHGDALVMAQEISSYWKQPNNITPIVSKETVALTLRASYEFKFGNSCQEFVPKNGMAQGAYMTYRKITKRVHATYYNVNGRECLAGVCYFLQLKPSRCINTTLDDLAIRTTMQKVRSISSDDRRLKDDSTQYSRHCEATKKQVLLHIKGKEVRHRVCDFVLGKEVDEECNVCNDDYNLYLREKEAKKQAEAEKALAEEQAAKKAAAEKAAAEKAAAKKAASEKARADQKAADERAEAERLHAANEKAREEKAAEIAKIMEEINTAIETAAEEAVALKIAAENAENEQEKKDFDFGEDDSDEEDVVEKPETEGDFDIVETAETQE